MGVDELREVFDTVGPLLDERQRRVLAGSLARVMGRGGSLLVGEAAGLGRSTMTKAVAEVATGVQVTGRVRGVGAGRKAVLDKDPGVLVALDELVEPTTRGTPMSALRWTCKSTRRLADDLSANGHVVSSWTVGQLLHRMGYSLQSNVKEREGSSHPDRNAQFEYINRLCGRRLAVGDPVISVDTKKKELVGDFKNGGQEWEPEGEPTEVRTHDFVDPVLGKAIPYGVYDIGANSGWVSVGSDHDTADFAVATIGRWWDVVGADAYPVAKRLLITADAGGSNGYRLRAFKTGLAGLAARTGLTVTVCHFPPGTSKWNKIEHRLFSAISMNWRGRPLESHEVIVKLIANTTTRTGLKVRAESDHGLYPTGVEITKQELAAVPMKGHKFHPEWNYDIRPPRPTRPPSPRTTRV